MLFHIIPYDSTIFHMIPYLPSERSHFIACCLKGFNEAFAKNKRIPIISASLAVQVTQERGIPRVSSIMTLASTTSLSMAYATSCSTKVWQLLLKRRYLSTSKVLAHLLRSTLLLKHWWLPLKRIHPRCSRAQIFDVSLENNLNMNRLSSQRFLGGSVLCVLSGGFKNHPKQTQASGVGRIIQRLLCVHFKVPLLLTARTRPARSAVRTRESHAHAGDADFLGPWKQHHGNSRQSLHWFYFLRDFP